MNYVLHAAPTEMQYINGEHNLKSEIKSGMEFWTVLSMMFTTANGQPNEM